MSALCEQRGATAVTAPLIETRPPRDLAALDSSLLALGAGRYSWLFITSSASAEVLRQHGVVVPGSTAIAAVGDSTWRALEEAGYPVAFVPTGASSSQSLVQQWKLQHSGTPAQEVLVMRSDLATATVSDELTLAGHSVEVCIAYRTVGIDLSAEIRDQLIAGLFDTVLVTSHSVAMELDGQLDPLPAATLFACLGPGTAREAERLGLSPIVTATDQSIDSLLDAAEAFYSRSTTEGHTP